MTPRYDVAALGNAIVDVIAPAEDAFLTQQALIKGSMQLIDEAQGVALYGHMASAIEASGGSAGNTVAGVASFGGAAAFVGKVADDQLGDVYAHDMQSIGVDFSGGRLIGGAATGRCLINVTPDGQRTMCTYLGAANQLHPDDVDPAVIEQAKIVYLEGYLFDPEDARRAFAKAAGLARASDRLIAITLSDSFVVERHRGALLGFIETEVDIVLANEAEACALFETSDVDAAIAALAERSRIAVVTRGAAGSVIAAGGALHSVAAFPVEAVIDSTGAGDQFAAGFLFGLAQGRSYEVCGRLGALAAAEVIGHYGPRPQTNLAALAKAQGLI
jgi:sugar/nucleoside kinase (ribokinase family)